MKEKRIFISLLFTFIFYLLSAQTPQGFNYQAIARDASGNQIPNANLQVKLAVLGDSLGTTVYWEELFNPVTTNAFGLFTVILGRGTRQATSTVTTFQDVNWKVTPVFVRTQIYYQNVWKNMGSSRLWSVPYALSANDVTGPLQKLKVTGTTTSMDSALFEVKNNTGQTIFAVYNEGVRIYVDDGLAKGNKGGFAIGSFGSSKAPSQSLMVVRKDTVRIYVDDTPGKNNKGGFAIGGFNKAKGSNESFFDVATDGSGIINPSQNRMLWYPLKNAFLVGKVLIESPDSVGLNSFASGYESKAKGNYSEAFGFQSAARGLYSTAMGYQSSSTGDFSVALGYSSIASGNFSFAMGISTKATGLNSFALGDGSQALGSWTYAFGFHNIAINGGPTYAFGDGTLADHWGATTFGWQTKAQATHSTAMGEHTTSKARSSLVIGQYNILAGNPDFWLSGDPAFVIGNGVDANNPSNAFTVLKNGNTFVAGSLGVGTSTPQSKLEVIVSGFDGYSGIGIRSTISGGKNITINQGTAGKLNFTVPGVVDLETMDFNSNRIGIMRTPTSYTLEVGGTIWANGATISSGSTTWSDVRYKKNIEPLQNALADVLKMQGVKYSWKIDDFPGLNFPKGEQVGVIAQEIEKIVPELVYTGPDGYKSVSYEKLTPILIEAIKDQQHTIDGQSFRIETLDKQIDTLKSRLDQMETILSKTINK
jgi:hypothetical protein